MPTAEQRAFWAAIRANPDDDTVRLVYADWLEENGDEARAEFIRVQIEQTGMFSPSALCSDPNDRTLTKREKRLIARHGERWLQPLYDILQPTERSFPWAYSRRQVKFARGFPRDIAISLQSACALATHDSDIEPLNDVKIDQGFLPTEKANARITEVARWANAACITEISTYDATDGFVKGLVGGFLTRLHHLDLHSGSVSDAGAILLANWQQAAFRMLDLSDNRITNTGAVALAESPHASNLSNLNLNSNLIGPDGRRRLRERFGKDVQIEAGPT